jgi:hypothetical protein
MAVLTATCVRNGRETVYRADGVQAVVWENGPGYWSVALCVGREQPRSPGRTWKTRRGAERAAVAAVERGTW